MHKDYCKKPEIYEGTIPSTKANEIADLFAQGKSIVDVLHSVRIDGRKVSKSTLEVMYSHLELIEGTIVNILNGTSIIYQANPVATMPNNEIELFDLLMQVIALDGDNFANVYDATFEELSAQVNNVMANILDAQSGTFEEFKQAVTV